MGNKLIIGLVFIMILITFVSANSISSLGTFKQGESIELKQTCADCSYINFTRVSYPNGTRALGNVQTTKEGSIFNYTFYNTTELGTYIVEGIGDVDGVDTVFAYNFEITPTGKGLSSAKATAYVIILIISILIFIGLLYFGIAIPSKNKRDEMTGYILAVNNLKYLKYVILGFSYLTLLWVSYFSWMITYAYLDFDFLTNIFRFMFTFLAILTLPLFILFVFLTITNGIRDSKLNDFLLRGLRTR